MAEEKKEKKETKEKAPKEGKASSRAEKVSAPKWTLERCKKFARRFEDENRWAAGHSSSYKSAQAHGWTAECVAQMHAFKGQSTKPMRKAA